MNKAFINVLAFAIVVPIVAALFTWYNHVLSARQFAYWQWLLIALPVVFVAKQTSWLNRILSLVFAVCLIAQFAAWAGMLTLPLFR